MRLKQLYPLLVLLAFLACETESADIKNNVNPDEDSEDLVLNLTQVFQNIPFSQPLDLQSPNDGTNRIFVVEKQGKIKVFENDVSANSSTTFLDLGGNLSTESEQGLLGLTFHPDYQSNGYFYVFYNPTSSVSYISRFSASSDNNIADSNSELVLLQIPQTATNHNGGQLAFGNDGYLYISSGDGGGDAEDAQDNSNLLGTIIRIDVDNPNNGLNYGIPSDNPFVGNSNVREEIYAYGFRNPWRMSFDSQAGDLWVGDVGQNAIEEIDVVVAGGNFGWNFYEGTSCYSGDCDDSGLIAPIFEYEQGNGDRSITGGYVYRGDEVSLLNGKYVYGDFVSGRIWTMDVDGSDNQEFQDTGYNIAAFGTDSNLELYLLDLSGAIYKFEEGTPEN